MEANPWILSLIIFMMNFPINSKKTNIKNYNKYNKCNKYKKYNKYGDDLNVQ